MNKGWEGIKRWEVERQGEWKRKRGSRREGRGGEGRGRKEEERRGRGKIVMKKMKKQHTKTRS